ncbi:MAG: HDOD domain-containing protein [Aromatoleum sp.]|jgi:HD-like signal output (HDOD) protein|uniref:HDOD domain-containing protein n=1 Tax=Aromatoleum sp. TaxID=2307007 RepID=UPI00289506B3|nr:HDOD domain-containing protein [Aromatoleum sp.]MDT3672827.1 HDOD domain-containing protein [Aromatoleum sp.]
MAFLDAPLDSVDAYVRFLSAQDMPVLRQTVRELEALRTAQDSISGKRIAAVVLADPLMTAKLLATLQATRTPAQNRDITTIDRAIMMMGVGPFFDMFSAMPTVEDVLADRRDALVGVLKVIGRARKATHYARDWAILRHDLDVDEITVAALLLEAVDILCWTFAPALTLQVHAMQHANRWLRSAEAQRAVFGVSALEIQVALVRAWKLPDLLVALMDESSAANPRVHNVLLAADFARHVADGWSNDALPDDIAEIEKLVRVPREALLARLGVPGQELYRFFPPAT